MFKKLDAPPSITGVKADEKFSVEGAAAYVKEKVVSDLAVQQELDRLKRDEAPAAKGQTLVGTLMNKEALTSTTKFSPFRSQRTTSVGTAINNSVSHVGQLQIKGVQSSQQKCVKLIKPDPNMIRRLLNEEKDERYRYLLRHGNILNIESESLSLYVELP